MSSFSDLLYDENDLYRPITPYIGMNLGDGSPKSDYSPWVKMLCFKSRTTSRIGKNNNSHHRSWVCNSESCPWELKINFSKRRNSWFVTQYHSSHTNCSSTGSLDFHTASNLVIKELGNDDHFNAKKNRFIL